jgi:tRNA modification GTPase
VLGAGKSLATSFKLARQSLDKSISDEYLPPMAPCSIIQDDTIVAIATPPGEGGIGILRLSGPKAPKVLSLLYRGPRKVEDFESHRLYQGKFIDPRTEELIDEGLAVWMRAPHSYTAEEVVELHAHGGPLILNQLLELCLQESLRIAEPGEFTRRAFLNGKLDLLQAEAVGEMIHAKSEAALRNARAQLEGRLSDEVEQLRERLLFLLARVEAAIDFPEEDIELMESPRTLGEVEAVETILKAWLEKFHLGRLVREGVKLALVGRPNVGKSSLLNKLLGEDRAIVHVSPGTTRDVIEGWMTLGGVSFQVFDTAGIREGEGEVEREGILRPKRVAAGADLTLWVLDASSPLTEEDRQIALSLTGSTLLVGNKSDLGIRSQILPNDWAFSGKGVRREWLFTSAHNGDGIEALRQALFESVGLQALQERAESFLNNARHLSAVRGALEALRRAKQALVEGLPAECVASDLQAATHSLEALLGRISSEDVLDKIFSEFCIGK